MFKRILLYVSACLFMLFSPCPSKGAWYFQSGERQSPCHPQRQKRKSPNRNEGLSKDIVEAAKNSRAKIVMLDKNEINITPETKLEIADYEFSLKAAKKNVLLNVIHGKIRAKVKQNTMGLATIASK